MGLADALKEAVDFEPVGKARDGNLEETVKAGTFFVVVDVSVAGGRMIVDKIFKGAKAADAAAEKYRSQGRNVQVIDALWYEPARKKLQASGVVPANEDLDALFAEAADEEMSGNGDEDEDGDDEGDGEGSGSALSGKEIIKQLRAVSDSGEDGEVDGESVDNYTASAVVTLFDALTPENKAKYLAKSLPEMIDLCLKILARED